LATAFTDLYPKIRRPNTKIGMLLPI
jgi:hypothetical protein